MENMSDFLSVALKAGHGAEKIIMKQYQGEIKVELKADQSPVTATDREAETVIIKTLRDAFPSHGFLAEESGSDRPDAEYVWIIDPIDGTKSYSRKVPLFGTLIALMKGQEIIVGVSNVPVLGECMYAEKGRGAYLNDTEVHVSKVDNLAEAYVSFGSLKSLEEFNFHTAALSLARIARANRTGGECWSHNLVAQGKVDSMAEAHINIWDIAPIKIIVEEAGGMVTDLEGKPITRNTTSALATNGILHTEILEFFSKTKA